MAFLLFVSIVLIVPRPAAADEPDLVTNKPVPPARALAERAKLYWGYKVSDDLDKAYLLEDPRLREKLSLKDYLTNVGTGVKWLEAEIGAVNLDQDPARVTVTLRFAMLMGGYSPKSGRKRTIQDKWVLINNQWYHHMKQAKPGLKRKSTPITVRKEPTPNSQAIHSEEAAPIPAKKTPSQAAAAPTPESSQAAATDSAQSDHKD